MDMTVRAQPMSSTPYHISAPSDFQTPMRALLCLRAFSHPSLFAQPCGRPEVKINSCPLENTHLITDGSWDKILQLLVPLGRAARRVSSRGAHGIKLHLTKGDNGLVKTPFLGFLPYLVSLSHFPTGVSFSSLINYFHLNAWIEGNPNELNTQYTEVQ